MSEPEVSPSEPQFPIFRSCPFTPPDEYRAMRATGRPAPARIYNGNRVWVITGYDDARAALNDPRFSSDITNPGYPLPAEAYEGSRAFPTLFTMDPPQHTAQRKMMISEFSAKKAIAQRPEMQKTADDLIDAMLADSPGPVDLVTAFAKPFAGQLTCRQLGMSYSDMQMWLARNRDLAEKSMSLSDTENVQEAVGNSILDMQNYFLEQIDAKEREPADDPVSRAVVTHVATGKMSKVELANLCFLIFFAGQNPVEAVVTLGTAILLDHPDQLEILRTEPETMPGAVDELMRYISPLDVMARVAVEDVELNGQLIRKGDGVVVANGAANHDPAEYPEPERIDVRRPNRRHLAFGTGVHSCLGLNVTRVGLEVAFETLFRRLPGLRLEKPFAELPFSRERWHPEMDHLPVLWDG